MKYIKEKMDYITIVDSNRSESMGFILDYLYAVHQILIENEAKDRGLIMTPFKGSGS